MDTTQGQGRYDAKKKQKTKTKVISLPEVTLEDTMYATFLSTKNFLGHDPPFYEPTRKRKGYTVLQTTGPRSLTFVPCQRTY